MDGGNDFVQMLLKYLMEMQGGALGKESIIAPGMIGGPYGAMMNAAAQKGGAGYGVPKNIPAVRDMPKAAPAGDLDFRLPWDAPRIRPGDATRSQQ